jgi:Cu-processing system permease protein
LRRTEIIAAIARKELIDRFRNRWILVVGGLLVLSALVISFLGAVPVGLAGFQRSGMTLVSLINLAIYLVPLLALSLGAFAIIDEKTNGTLDLLLSYPLSAGEYLAGTFLGLTLALGAAILIGFGSAGALLLSRGGIVTPVQFLLFLILTFFLGVIFLALALVISLASEDRGRAMAIALCSWIAAVFLFDILLVGALLLAGERLTPEIFGAVLLLNPVDVFRLLAFSLIEGARIPVGLTSVDFPAFLSAPRLTGVFVAWAVFLLLLVRSLFRRRIGGGLGSEAGS